MYSPSKTERHPRLAAARRGPCTARRRYRGVARAIGTLGPLLAAVLALGVIAGRAHAQATPPATLRASVPGSLGAGLAIVLDTSTGAGNALATPAPYDPGTDYGAHLPGERRCDARRVYWRTGPGPAPDCATAGSVNIEATDITQGLRCDSARTVLPQTGVFVSARLAQWDSGRAGGVWRAPARGHEGALECREDRGRHGAAGGNWYAVDGTTGWAADADREIDWDAPPLGDVYLLYSGNYLNYLQAGAAAPGLSFAGIVPPRLEAALQSALALEVTLLRLSHDGGSDDAAAQGGMVIAAWSNGDAATTAGAAREALAAAAGAAPLAEATVEALRVVSGAAVDFGLDSHAAPAEPLPSHPSSRNPVRPGRYRDPYPHACRPLSVAVLAAGTGSADAAAAAHAADLPGLAGLDCGQTCLPALAARLPQADLRPDLSDAQRPQLIVASPAAARATLAPVARVSGFHWIDLARADALFELVAAALQHDAAALPEVALTPPALLPRDALSHEAAAFVGLARPEARLQPPGNLRRYGFAASGPGNGMPVLTGLTGEAALDSSTRTLVPDGWSLWSAAPDGADPLAGGAAARLPPPALRRLYSDLEGDDLSAADNRVEPDNTRISAQALGLAAADTLARERLLWALLGRDGDDRDGDGDREEPLASLAAPRDEPPRVIRYDADDARVLFFTRSGRLHAIDAATGIESWSFLPAPLLARAAMLDANPPTVNPAEYLGAEARLHRFDANGDGRIRREDGDHVWLLFGLRDEPVHYALDLTEPDAPRRLWRRGVMELPGLVDARTRAAIARLEIADADQNHGHWVVLLAGGHDALLEGPVPQPDRSAPHLYLLDAESGELLWHAAGDATGGPDLRIAGFDNGLAAPPRLLDLDGDGQLDRAYAVDVIGRVWRLDFSTGETRAALARASLFATLGASDATARDAAALRFHQEPDVARAVGGPAGAYLAVSLGSGNRARPRGVDATDRFYSLRDPAVLPRSAPATEPILEHDLVDVTTGGTVGADEHGWLLRLEAHGAGEKTAATARTLDHRVLFTTWQPAAALPARPCHPAGGRARLYDLALVDGAPRHLVREGVPDPQEDIALTLADPHWPGRVQVALPGGSSDCDHAGCRLTVLGLVGGEAVPLLLDVSPRRVTWRDLGIDAATR